MRKTDAFIIGWPIEPVAKKIGKLSKYNKQYIYLLKHDVWFEVYRLNSSQNVLPLVKDQVLSQI